MRALPALLSLLLAAPALAAPAAPGSAPRAVAARAAPEARAERDGDMVKLSWSGLAGPVRIERLDTPDARRGQQLVAGVIGNEARVPAAAFPRPYFRLAGARGQQLIVAERVLPLEGGVNFRDLGGYATADGARVKWGQLYRSGVMAGLTANDYRALGQLGIATVCDLRSSEERSREAVNWPEGVRPTVLTRDYALDMGPLMAAFAGGAITPERTAQALAGFYRELPFTFAADYRRMFAELVAGRAPLAFNCSAGKDRTGVAAVLLLTALGVPRETAIEDYLLSNVTFRPRPPAPGAAADATSALIARLPAEVQQALMGVDRLYIEAALAAIEERGGMDRYLTQDLGLDAAARARLRARYLSR